MEHIALADQADLVLIAPATANVLAKLAHGIADDMLTTTVLACNCPKIAAPAMNTKMYENPVAQDNLERSLRPLWQGGPYPRRRPSGLRRGGPWKNARA